MYDQNSPNSIINFAKKLKETTLRGACGIEIEDHEYHGKGNFGQVLEKFYFGYEPNSVSEPDFKSAKIELKSSPLKILRSGAYRSKERLVLNIIDYLKVINESFETSSFYNKNAHLLLIFYLYDRHKNILDYIIKLVSDWKYSEEDLKVIKYDWEVINQKIKDGRAHELSEGDTFFLAASTKGSTAISSIRSQPFNSENAKQRAYSLKKGYVNHIIAKIAHEETAIYGKIIQQPQILDKLGSLEHLVISKFEPFYEKSTKQIEVELGININDKAKSYFANLSNAILGIELGQKIEEFEKADIIVKTVRLKENNLPKEDISFPTFKYKELVENNWDDSDLKNILESKFFFVFYQFQDKNLILKKVKFWNMSYPDILEAKGVWESTVKTVSNGKIVKEVTDNGIRKTFFPKKSANRICHVRPHARNKVDNYELPVVDELTELTEYTKHCFWLNASYIRDEVFLK